MIEEKKYKFTELEMQDIKIKIGNFIQSVKPFVKNVQLTKADWEDLCHDSFADIFNKEKT